MTHNIMPIWENGSLFSRFTLPKHTKEPIIPYDTFGHFAEVFAGEIQVAISCEAANKGC